MTTTDVPNMAQHPLWGQDPLGETPGNSVGLSCSKTSTGTLLGPPSLAWLSPPKPFSLGPPAHLAAKPPQNLRPCDTAQPAHFLEAPALHTPPRSWKAPRKTVCMSFCPCPCVVGPVGFWPLVTEL